MGSSTLLRNVFLASFLFTIDAVSYAQNGAPGQDVNKSFGRTVSVGPYSTVDAYSGSVMTNVVLFSIPGPGDLSLMCSVQHRSNTVANSSYAEAAGTPGRGWTLGQFSQLTVDDFGNTGPGGIVTFFSSGNGVAAWQQGLNAGQYSFAAEPGTKLKLDRVPAGGTLNYFEVTSYGKTTYSRFKPLTSGFNGNSVLDIEIDDYGNWIDYSYDLDGRLTTVADSEGRSYVITYETGGGLSFQHVDKITLYVGAESFVYDFYADPNGLLGQITFPHPNGGGTPPDVLFWYSGNDNITTLQDMRLFTWTYEYAVPSQMTDMRLSKYFKADPLTGGQQYRGASNPTTFSYISSPTTLECIVTEPFGAYNAPQTRVWSYFFRNGLGGEIPYYIDTEWLPFLQGTTAEYYKLYTWDKSKGDLRFFRNEGSNAVPGHTWEFQYNLGDDSGLVTYELNPEVEAVSFFYNNHLLTSVVTHENRVTEYVYNGTGTNGTINSTGDVIQEKRDPAGLNIVTHYEYGESWHGNATKTYMTGEGATATVVQYNDLGFPTQSTDGDGNTTSFVYDWRGKLLSTTEPLPVGTTTNIYDDWGRLIETIHPGGVDSVEYGYDFNGNIESATDEASTATTSYHDGWNQLKSSTIYMGTGNAIDDRTVTYAYDASGNQVGVTNAEGETTTKEYDVLDRLTKVSYPYTGSSTTTVLEYQYFIDGPLMIQENGRNQTVTYTYDKQNRVKTVNYSDATPDITYIYDNDGLRKTMAEVGRGTQAYDYDALGRLTKHYQPFTSRSVVREYYLTSGRLKTLKVNIGNSYTNSEQVWTYIYDSTRHLLQEITQLEGDASLATFEYYPNGQLKQTDTGDRRRSEYTYSDRGFVTHIFHNLYAWTPTSAVYIFNDIHYSHDSRGNVTSYLNGYSLPNQTWSTNQFDYQFNRANELVSEVPGQFSDWLTSSTYSYDRNGNREGQVTDGVTYSSTFDANDRLLNRNSSSTDDIYYQNYDKDGNPGRIVYSQLRTLNLTYNSRNDISQISYSNESPAHNGTSYFKYDGDGRRIEKKETYDGSQTTTRYVYDGETAVAEVDGSNALTMLIYPGVGYVVPSMAAGGGGGGGPLNPLIPIGGGGGYDQFYTLSNGVGSTVKILDSNSNIVTAQDNLAFGRPNVVVDSQETGRGFKGDLGYVTDDQRGSRLFFLGRRFYSHDTGRFVTQDPTGHGDGLNLYSYTDNNPLVFADPLGLTKVIVFWYNVWGGGHHTGILIIDNMKGGTSPTWSFAGGPQIPYPGYGNAVGHFYGDLVSKSGDWISGTQDFDWAGPWNGSGMILVDDDSQASVWIQKFEAIEAKMNGIGVYPYDLVPTGLQAYSLAGVMIMWPRAEANSNSWARELIQRAGLMDQYRKAMNKRRWYQDGGYVFKPLTTGWAKDPWGNIKKPKK